MTYIAPRGKSLQIGCYHEAKNCDWLSDSQNNSESYRLLKKLIPEYFAGDKWVWAHLRGVRWVEQSGHFFCKNHDSTQKRILFLLYIVHYLHLFSLDKQLSIDEINIWEYCFFCFIFILFYFFLFLFFVFVFVFFVFVFVFADVCHCGTLHCDFSGSRTIEYNYFLCL